MHCDIFSILQIVRAILQFIVTLLFIIRHFYSVLRKSVLILSNGLLRMESYF